MPHMRVPFRGAMGSNTHCAMMMSGWVERCFPLTRITQGTSLGLGTQWPLDCIFGCSCRILPLFDLQANLGSPQEATRHLDPKAQLDCHELRIWASLSLKFPITSRTIAFQAFSRPILPQRYALSRSHLLYKKLGMTTL